MLKTKLTEFFMCIKKELPDFMFDMIYESMRIFCIKTLSPKTSFLGTTSNPKLFLVKMLINLSKRRIYKNRKSKTFYVKSRMILISLC